MRILLVVFCLFFISSIFADHHEGWEGTYDWSGSGTDVAYNCYEDGWIFGTAGHILTWAARVHGDIAIGKWWAVGYKHGGPRWGQSQNGPTTGSVRVIMKSEGNLIAQIQYRGSHEWYTIQLGDRTSTSVTNRIPNCGIMDPSSTDSIAGEWTEQESSGSTDANGFYCVDGKDFEGSYTYVDEESGDEVTGYLVGKCSWDGKVCRSDWMEYPYFGVQIDRLLSDGTMGTIWWTGPTAYVTSDTEGVSYVSDLTSSSASNAECSANSDDMVWPFKCLTKFLTTEDCEANPYYCRVRQSNGKCRKVHFKTSKFHW